MRAACRLISEEFEWWTARWQRRRMRFWPLTASIMSWEEAGKRLCLGPHLTLPCCLHRPGALPGLGEENLIWRRQKAKSKRLGTTAGVAQIVRAGTIQDVRQVIPKAVLLFWAQNDKIWRWSRGHGHLQRDWFYGAACKKNRCHSWLCKAPPLHAVWGEVTRSWYYCNTEPSARLKILSGFACHRLNKL